ncbi:MAG: outer membrane beta-barrel protein [Paludibacteraceae bacterium]|nr:outer membrane beta-barrel protein [Paludibacteraceae bacterium]
MKKLIFASAALCAAATISAQEVVEAQAQPQAQVEEAPAAKNFKPGSERFGAEAGLSLGNGFGLNGGNLNFNFTLSDEWMVRLGFGVNVDKLSSKDEDGNKSHLTESTFNVKPGIIYSFSGTDRLEPYVGGEFVFGLTSTCNYSNTKVDGATYEKENRTRTSNFGANAVTGFNFYVAKDLYVGAEVGLGFLVTPKSHNFGTDDEGKEYDSKDEKSKSHTTRINPICTPSVRVGWKF